MTDDRLYEYFRGEASEQEISAIEKWLGENPENTRRFNEAQAMYVAMVMAAPKEVLERGSKKRHPGAMIRWVIRVCAVAACVAAIVTVTVLANNTMMDKRLAETMTTVSAPAGQCVNITLHDGTNVWLNSGTSIEYPARFGRQRKVNVEGEALFDVAKDERHPFIVKTYACDVKVLGTRFNVFADKENGIFKTSLLRGKVQVVNNTTGQSVVLSPEQSVTMKDGRLTCERMENHDDLMWNEGIISLYGDSFKALMDRFGRAFGVSIDVNGTNDPQIRTRGKVRVAEGVTHALEVLKNYINFSYDYDIDNNVVTITLE